MGKVSHFLGIEFTWKELPDGHLSVSLTQQSFIESLLDSLNMKIEGISSYSSPYRSGHHIDSIPCQDMTTSELAKKDLKLYQVPLVYPGMPFDTGNNQKPSID